MRQIVYQIANHLTDTQDKFIIVSSGAITSGKAYGYLTRRLAQKQAAAIGQILLFQKYYEFFKLKVIVLDNYFSQKIILKIM